MPDIHNVTYLIYDIFDLARYTTRILSKTDRAIVTGNRYVRKGRTVQAQDAPTGMNGLPSFRSGGKRG